MKASECPKIYRRSKLVKDY